ncbi:MAG: hypothetical protein M1834_005646 [Cirrosporium novae-zelandiae]|nr:MAG: hypothetical protein M1834_005646 [Cirrosporium novae-zelandiae]
MSAGHNDPRLLYSIKGIEAYHIQNGEESSLTPSGPQTLSLLMVPTSSPFADLSSTQPQSDAPEEDFYLHLHLPPELDLPLPATTQIYHQPPRSYLIPRWDLGPESGAFTRIEFPSLGTEVTQEDVDTFETILAQCTAFLERAQPPPAKGSAPSYNPAEFQPGEAYIGTGLGKEHAGQIVLINEEDGSVVGELSEGFNVVETENVHPGSKTADPVQIQLPQEGQGNQITVQNADEEYLQMARHPAYKNSTIVQNAAVASRLIVTGSTFISNALTSGADSFTRKTKPNPKPMTFAPTTHARVRRISTMTQSAAGISSKTVGQIGKYAQNFGASMVGRGERKKKVAYDKDGKPIETKYKPGLLNKSMMAFSTITDGLEHSARQLLSSGSAAATTVVGHRYGEEAGRVTFDLTSGVTNVGLVYVDAAGVSRKAIIKSVAKGMVVGKMPNGQELVVGAGDGGVVPSNPSHKVKDAKGSVSNDYLPGANPSGDDIVGYGNAAPPPAYRSGVGESMEGQPVYGRGHNGKGKP